MALSMAAYCAHLRKSCMLYGDLELCVADGSIRGNAEA